MDGSTAAFSETSLANDINEACKRGTTGEIPGIKELPTVEARLEKLDQLKAKGLIEDREYSNRRQQIIDEI